MRLAHTWRATPRLQPAAIGLHEAVPESHVGVGDAMLPRCLFMRSEITLSSNELKPFEHGDTTHGIRPITEPFGLHDLLELLLTAGNRRQQRAILGGLTDTLLLLDDAIELQVHFAPRREHRLHHPIGQRFTRLDGRQEARGPPEDAVHLHGLAGQSVRHHRRGIVVVEGAQASRPGPPAVE
jgi:hypothetical protein